jgi:CHASE2 domain-containing sensor protein
MRGDGRQRRKAALLLGVALAAAALSLVLEAHHVLRRPEQVATDARFQIRGTDRALVAGEVVVPIDDATLQRLGVHWPYPRRYHARVVDALRRAGAKVIAFDVQFTEPTDPGDDNALIRAFGRAHNLVLSTTDVGPHGSTNILGGDAVVRSLGARAGDTSVFPDSDGTIRNTQYAVLGLKTFGVAVAEAATGRPVPVARFGGPRAQVPIDYAGPPGTVTAVPYWRVYAGRFLPATFAGKIVIVGASSASLGDNHEAPTSGGTEMSGPELLANAAGTVLHGLPLRYASVSLTHVLIVTLALCVFLAGMRLATIGVALTGLGLIVGWSLAAQLAFNSGVLLDFSDPAASLLLTTGGTMLVGLWAENRERRRLRNLFAADSGSVVEQVLGKAGSRPLEPTAIIGGYRIETPIGRGGMGVVYRATQLALDRPVAIKLIAAELAQDPVFRERFTLESRLAAAIEHVNVIPVYEAGEDDGLLFIAMRLVEGTDLAQVLARGGALDPERASSLVAQLAGALDAAHAHALVHRDVKPANVLLTLDEPEHAYLTDFGLAKHIGAEGRTMAGQWVGTLDYISPEQIRGEGVGAPADLYALAALLHHCLTGQVPFPRDNDPAKLWAHINAAPPAPSQITTGLPAAIDDIIARGMAKDPAARYPTAGELARACATALGLAAAARRPAARPISAGDVAGAPEAWSPTVISE